MITITRILCPVDFSEYSRHALDHAAAIARCYVASVVALHVVPPVMPLVPSVGAPIYPPFVYTPEDIEEYRIALDTFVRHEAGGSGIPIEVDVVEGGPARTIVERAEILRADLLVMGTHGRSGFERLMLGSVTER